MTREESGSRNLTFLRRCALALLACLLAAGSAGAGQPENVPEKKKKEAKKEKAELRKAEEQLPEKYRVWLDNVQWLITADERKTFLGLEKDYQRDAFIKRFWEIRDPYPETARNELRDRWEGRLAEARASFGGMQDERSKIFLINGPPNGHIGSRCTTLLWPLEIWYYAKGTTIREDFVVVFYQRWGAGHYRVWNPGEGLEALFVNWSLGQRGLEEIAQECRDGDQIAGGISWVQRQGMGYTSILAKLEQPPKGPTGEWVSTFNSYSTEVPPDAPTFPAKLDLEYPGRRQNRTVLQGILAVEPADIGQATLGEHRSYNLLLTGEVLEGGELFDSFRYKYDFPAAEVRDSTLPLVFQRYLRPGTYRMVVKLEDLNGGKFFRLERAVTVPQAEGPDPAPPPADTASAKLLAEANAALSRGETTVKIVAPAGDLHTGMVRFDTLTTGQIAKVTFALDGKPVMTKSRPPYSVELDLGSLPRTRNLTAIAYDGKGEELASDVMALNAAGHRFTVRLIEPQRGKRYQSSLPAQADVRAPEGEVVERVEFYLNETRVATLYQPPFVQPIVLPKDLPLSYVRVVAYLTDGASTEDLAFVNAPDDFQQLKVQFVELYTTVLDRQGRPVEGLEQKDFSVTEDGVRQEIVRFEKVEDLPIHAGILMDISASMEPNVEATRQAALEFFERTVKPKDRAALITFNDRPTLAVKFTKDVTSLAGGLAGIKAERGTALYDSLIFALYYFNGVRGQRALLLLSDGKDQGSKFTYDEALEYARRAGVTVYAVGLGKDLDKKKLTRIADDTGGRSFFVENASELAGIYAAIEKELRSQYLIAYQSTNAENDTDFRAVDLKVGRSGLEAKTLRGYYP